MPVDPVSTAVSAANLLVGGVQSLIGAGQEKRANRELSRLFKQRKAYSTPQEILDIVQMQENNAQTGFGAETLDYLTTGADRGMAAGLDTAKMLGADPNALGGILDGYFQDIFKIGGENELAKMKKFDGLINATQLLADNKVAEQISADNLIKDQMAAKAQQVAAGTQNIQSGLNLGLNALSTFANSYRDTDNGGGTGSTQTNITTPGAVVNPGQRVLTPSQQRRLQEVYANP